MNGIKHFKTITHHKMLVMRYCFKVGLYKQGLLHDLSKYRWAEFKVGVKYFQGNKSPNGVEKIKEGYSSAWLHHKGRNKHHFEYWIDYGVNPREGLIGAKMPLRYVVEMFIDRMCASKNYERDKYTDRSSLIYYDREKDFYVIHKETKALLEKLLNMLADEGEEKTLEYIKRELLPMKEY